MGGADRGGDTGGVASDAGQLELLVHGVGGTTPAEMLGDPRVVRISGDDVAGLYRIAGDEPGGSGDRHASRVREAYCWARLTSGSASRALWLLLVPFLLVNVAFWMRPRRGERTPGALAAVHDWLLRLLGLSLTVLFVASASEVTMDLAAWQCGGSAQCSRGRAWLEVFGGPDAGARLAVGALVPIAVVAGLWLLSRWTWRAYEAHRLGAGNRPGGDPDDADAKIDPELLHSLADPDFWTGRAADRFRGTHVGAALAFIGLELALAVLHHDAAAGNGLRYADTAAVALAGAVLAACAVHPLLHAAAGRGADGEGPAGQAVLASAAADRLLRRLGLAGCGALSAALGLVLALVPRDTWATPGALPGAHAVMGILLGGQLLLLVLLTATTALQHRCVPAADAPSAPIPAQGRAADEGSAARGGADIVESGPGAKVGGSAIEAGGGPVGPPADPRLELPGFGGDGRPALHGLAAPAAAALAVGAGTLFTTCLDLRIEDLVDRGRGPGTAGGSALAGAPAVLSWLSATAPCWVLLLLVTGAVLARRARRAERRLDAVVREAYHAEGDRSGARARQIAATVARARLTDGAAGLLGTTAAGVFVLCAVSVAGALVWRQPPQVAFRGPLLTHGAAEVLQQAGSWLTLAVAALGVALAHRAYSSPGTRRTVGILWDVGTFWPRAAHPLAPPCYAERAVLDLVWRARTWCAATGGRLVLSAHSQGTVLAAAAARQLDPAARSRIAVLTYGSPLLRLYARFFPAFFAGRDLEALRRDQPWRNLYRFTDPIGGPTRLTGVDAAPFRDPAEYGRTPRQPLPSPILGHGDYSADPRFGRELGALFEALERRKQESIG